MVVVELIWKVASVLDALRTPMDNDMVEDDLGDVAGRLTRLDAPDFVDVVSLHIPRRLLNLLCQVPWRLYWATRSRHVILIFLMASTIGLMPDKMYSKAAAQHNKHDLDRCRHTFL